MSCIADYSFVFWSGNADFEPYVSFEAVFSVRTQKNARKYQIVKHLLVGAANVGSID